ncbi:MAG: hypothetical protein R2712_21180 [Vicinamibacterales bacterium]
MAVERGVYRVALQGELTGRDLARLEWACGPALERQRVPLILRLGGVTAVDEPSQAFLSQLERRGASLEWH